MSEKDIILKAIDLLKAIKEDNLNEAKELVTWLNENFIQSENLPSFNEIFPFYELYQNSFNKPSETLVYVLNNLQNVENIDRIKWVIQVQQLIINGNIGEIKSFIIDCLAQEEMKDYYFPSLVQLCVTIDNYDLLEVVRNKLADKEV